MAVPTTFKFSAGLLYIGDSSATPVYTKICGLTELSISIDKSTNEVAIPDCDSPDLAVWNVSDVTAMGWSASASGFAAKDAIPLVEAASLSVTSRPVRIYLKGGGTGAGTPDRLFSGMANIRHEVALALNDRATISIEMTGDGALTVTSSTIPA